VKHLATKSCSISPMLCRGDILHIAKYALRNVGIIHNSFCFCGENHKSGREFVSCNDSKMTQMYGCIVFLSDGLTNHPCNMYAGASVRWHVTMGSTPITGKTPGASEPRNGTSILPGVFNGGINAVVARGYLDNLNECSIHSCSPSAWGCSQPTAGYDQRRVLAVEPKSYDCVTKSTATFSYPTKYALSPKCRISGNDGTYQQCVSTYKQVALCSPRMGISHNYQK